MYLIFSYFGHSSFCLVAYCLTFLHYSSHLILIFPTLKAGKSVD